MLCYGFWALWDTLHHKISAPLKDSHCVSSAATEVYKRQVEAEVEVEIKVYVEVEV